MDDWAKRCEEWKEGKTFLVRKILEEIKQEGKTMVTKPTELTKLFILKENKKEEPVHVEPEKPKGNISESGYDMDLCPF